MTCVVLLFYSFYSSSTAGALLLRRYLRESENRESTLATRLYAVYKLRMWRYGGIRRWLLLLEAPYVRHLPLYPRSRQIQLPPRFPGTHGRCFLWLQHGRPTASKHVPQCSSHRLSQVLNALRLPLAPGFRLGS